MAKKSKDVVEVSRLSRLLAEASTPEEVVDVERKIEAAESYMKKSGLYAVDQIRPLNETRMRARWKLGRLLSDVERGPGGRPSKKNPLRGLTGFDAFLKKIGLSKPTALECQRIGAMPEAELDKALAAAKRSDVLNSFADLLGWARPWWVKENRERRHRSIREAAKTAGGATAPVLVVAGAADPEKVDVRNGIGPFPLFYADPPWDFETYSEKGLEKSAEAHYETMSDDEIAGFLIQGKTVQEIAHVAAACYLWATSSNVHRAIRIMGLWGFEFKTSAVWIKDKIGTGYVFRNRHELLLYGTKGDMPAPQFVPDSVFEHPRGRHSAKPPEVRAAIERMYPDFDASTRIELFARGAAPGWTSYGFEAGVVTETR